MDARFRNDTRNPLVLSLSKRDVMSDDEERILESLPSGTRDYAAGDEFVEAGSRPTSSVVVLEGFAARSQVLASGARQLTALHLPGDFVDLHSLLLKVMDHGVVTMTYCTVATVPHDRLVRLSETHPHLSRLLWLSTVIDAAIHRAWMAAMGRRSAEGQIAHLVCELFLRLQAVERTDGNTFEFPVTQMQLADMLGKSTVHVNRALQALRAKALIVWRARRVTILDWERLQELADFDPTYLCLEREPR